MNKSTFSININRLVLAIAIILTAAGLALGIHAVINFNQASIIIEWSTASELDIAGYNLMRRDTEPGSFIKINPEIIPPSDDPLTGGDYAYTDTDVRAGNTYEYFLEEVSAEGLITHHGPITQEASNAARLNLAMAGVLLFGAIISAWTLVSKSRKIAEYPEGPDQA